MADKKKNEVTTTETTIMRRDQAIPATLDDVGQADVLAMITTVSAAQIQERIASGELESAPMLLTLEAGQQITGEILTDGVTTIEDVATHLPKEVKNWTIQMLHPETYAKGPKVSILGSAQLDRMLPAFMGCVVVIARGETKKQANKKQMTEYFVGLDKRYHGAPPKED